MEWINLGGGHHITRSGYDIPLLCSLVDRIRKNYNLEVYLEPGEAAALDAGALVATVLDIVRNRSSIAVLDTSATAHMPDVLEMPYRPHVTGSGFPGEKKYTYILGGVSCLAGDIIGEYSFDSPLKPGDRLVFTDMAHYSMVKTTTFNGVPLPAVTALLKRQDSSGNEKAEYKVVKEFSYYDFKSRLS